MTQERFRDPNPVLVEAANRSYHQAEAGLYDNAHPEIFWCERRHWESYALAFLAGIPSPRTILDIGAGTGFIGSVLAPFLAPEDAYLAADLSPEMLGRLTEKFQSVPFHVRTIVCNAEAIPLQDACVDLIVISSVFHHIANPIRAREEIVRVLKPGGQFAVMHEPNILFAESWVFRKIAAVASVTASRIDRPGPNVPTFDYAPVFRAVNRHLLDEGLIHKPLSAKDIQKLVDVHSPTAGGRFESFGFAPLEWTREGPMRGWDILAFETYHHLGKLDPSARAWRRACDRILHCLFPASGSLFSIVLRKPVV